jgi:hypothetical protein
VAVTSPFTVDVFATSSDPIAAVWFDVLFDSGELSASVPVSLEPELESFFPEYGSLNSGGIEFVGGANYSGGFGGSDVPFKLATISFESLETTGLSTIQLAWSDGDETALVGSGTLSQSQISFGSATVEIVLQQAITGDVNGDGIVDYQDLGIMAGNWNMTSGADLSMGDLNGDGAVDYQDLGIMAGNWNYGVTGTGTVVPEPATMGLLAIGGIAALIRRRRS